MSLESVVQAIRDRGQAEAEAILAEARAERARALEATRAEGQAEVKAAEARAREEAERRRVQDLARAELEARKIVLAAQKEVLDETRQRALARLGTLDENPLILKALLTANEAEWGRGGRVYSNAKDEPHVRRIVGDRYGGRIDCTGGVVIENADGTRRVDLRYETILQDVWNDSVREVAGVLWPSKASNA